MKKKITTSGAPAAPHILSQGIISDGLIFVSGQVHVKPDGSLVEGTTTDKIRQIMSNIVAILKASDAGLDNIVKVTIYVTDMSVMPELNKTYPTYFTEPFPAREALCVKELPLGASIEISVTAASKEQ